MKTKPTLFLIFILLLSQSSWSQFSFEEPDTSKIRRIQKENEYEKSIALIYLTQNYKTVGEKDSVKHYTWTEDKSICSYYQYFENNIEYFIYHCDEAKGVKEVIKFPKVSIEKAKAFVNTLFHDENNYWETEFSYHPDGAGCYYIIKQTENSTTIDLWCGC